MGVATYVRGATRWKMKIRVDGGGFDGQEEATVTIDKVRKLISVRPLYAREEVTYTLAAMAKMLLWMEGCYRRRPYKVQGDSDGK